MKSSRRASPNISASVWNPPDLEESLAETPHGIQREQVLAIFQREDAGAVDPRSGSAKTALHQKDAGAGFAAWQPGLLEEQAQVPCLDEWSFVDIAQTVDAPAWKPQVESSTAAARQERTATESELAALMERTRLQAGEIILNAQAEADDILLQAQTEIDELKREAHQQGLAQAQAEIGSALGAVQKLVGEVEAWRNELTSQGEHILVAMLKDISRSMFGDGVKLDAQLLHANLDRIMENAHGLGDLKVFLNPDDAKLLDTSWKEQQMLVVGEQVRVIPSANITRGGCLVKGNLGTVDGRVETQLDAILNTFDELDSAAG